MVIPSAVTKYQNIDFDKKTKGNFIFYDPNLPNLYETSNGKLPCVNEKLFKYYNYIPQQKTSSLRDGFYLNNE